MDATPMSGAYVVIAHWTAREGEEERVSAAIRKLIEPSRAEPGCRTYQPMVDPEEPCRFVLFEIYDDAAAYKAHVASEHFVRYALGEGIPLLEGRERTFYRTIGDGDGIV